MTAAVVCKSQTKGNALSGRSVPFITLASLSAGFLVHRSHDQYVNRHGLANASASARGMEAEGEGGDDGSGRQKRGIVILSLSCRCRCHLRFTGGSKGVSGRRQREAEAKGRSGRSKQNAEAKRLKQKPKAKGGREGSLEAEAAECSMLDIDIRHPSPAACRSSIARKFAFQKMIPLSNSKLSSVRYRTF